jgi:ATP-dependent RNA helicase RhlE
VTVQSFADLELSGRLLRALEAANYHTPTPIQADAIPLLLDGYDLLGIAQTGTGKTAAFTLPLLHNLEEDDERPEARCARALILAPTRELVIQIADSIAIYGQNMGMRHAVVMGGVGQRPQVNALKRGVDILIATPGRLLDLVNQGHVDLRNTAYLVLDEADRMLDMGFIRDVRKITANLPDERQTLLFSATMPAEISKLAREVLFEPKRIEIATRTVAVDRIDQRVHHVDAAAKRTRLTQLLAMPGFERVIVFTRTKYGADKVVKHLARDGVNADALHGNKSQGARQRALDNFRNGRSRVLVATDIASRGIDVDDVTHVINYELPNVPESYIHRIGRTARAGAHGIAISFCDASERGHLRSIERLIKRSLTVEGDGQPWIRQT